MGGGGTNNIVRKCSHFLSSGELCAQEVGLYGFWHTGQELHLDEPLAASLVDIGRDGGEHSCQEIAGTLTWLQRGGRLEDAEGIQAIWGVFLDKSFFQKFISGIVITCSLILSHHHVQQVFAHGGREAGDELGYFSVLERILHVSKILSHNSHQAVGESSRNSGSFTLDMSLVAIVEVVIGHQCRDSTAEVSCE